jgi:hypothetical protein
MKHVFLAKKHHIFSPAFFINGTTLSLIKLVTGLILFTAFANVTNQSADITLLLCPLSPLCCSDNLKIHLTYLPVLAHNTEKLIDIIIILVE